MRFDLSFLICVCSMFLVSKYILIFIVSAHHTLNTRDCNCHYAIMPMNECMNVHHIISAQHMRRGGRRGCGISYHGDEPRDIGHYGFDSSFCPFDIYPLSLSLSLSDYGARPSPRPDAVWLRTGDCAEHCPSRRPVYWSSALSVISLLRYFVVLSFCCFDRIWCCAVDDRHQLAIRCSIDIGDTPSILCFVRLFFMEWSLCFQSLFHFEVCGIFY